MIKPDMSHVLNHANTLSEHTAAAMLVEIMLDGSVKISRYCPANAHVWFPVCAWRLNEGVREICQSIFQQQAQERTLEEVKPPSSQL